MVGTKQKLSSVSVSSLDLPGQNLSIPFSPSAKNLGVTIDCNLSMKVFISQTVRSCNFHLRRIASIRKYLSTDATVKLLSCFILSRLDYCNSLLSGLPSSSIQPLQRIQNNAARLALRLHKFDHITHALQTLHWLPVAERIQYKICCLCFKSLNDSAPVYLSELLQLHTPARSLRSSSDPLKLRISRYRLDTYGARAFFCCGPVLWNKLPLSLRQSVSFDSFKSGLKTHLFRAAFP